MELERRLNQIAEFKLPMSVSKGYNIPARHKVLGYLGTVPEVLVDGESIDLEIRKLEGAKCMSTSHPGIDSNHPIYKILKKEFPDRSLLNGHGNIKAELHMIYDPQNDLTHLFAVPHREYSEKKKK
jgi:hypothetical protein